MLNMFKRSLKLSAEDKVWAKEVKDHDGCKCVICGDTEKLNSHHLIVREIHELKLDLRNGITLCPLHHMFSREISAHNNPIAFFFWMETNRPGQLRYLKEKMESILNENKIDIVQNESLNNNS